LSAKLRGEVEIFMGAWLLWGEGPPATVRTLSVPPPYYEIQSIML